MMLHPSNLVFALLLFILIFFASSVKGSPDLPPSSCPSSVDETSGSACLNEAVEISAFSDRSRASDWRDTVFDVGEVLYVAASVPDPWKDDFSIVDIDSVTVRAVPFRERFRGGRPGSFELFGSGAVTKRGRICEIVMESVSGDHPTQRRFRFTLKKGSFDFRLYRAQQNVVVRLLLRLRVRRGVDEEVVDRSILLRIGSFEHEGFQHSINIRYTPLWHTYGLKTVKKILSLSGGRDHYPSYQFLTGQNPPAQHYWVNSWRPDTARKMWEEMDGGFLSDRYAALNHFRNETLIGNKASLTLVLRGIEEESSRFYPKTYLLEREEERVEFFSMLRESQEDEYWILKPPNLGAAKGIRIMRKIGGEYFDGEDLIPSAEAVIDRLKRTASQYPSQRGLHLAQRYITNPLLYENGIKMDIRYYALVASVVPLRVLVHPVGYCFFASLPYDLTDFDVGAIHLSNLGAQVAKNGKQPSLVPNMKVSDVSEYFETLPEDPFNFDETVRRQVHHIFKSVLLQFNDTITDVTEYQMKNYHQYSLLAGDFLIDEDRRLWLNEVQLIPGLGMEGRSSIRREDLPFLVIEALDIAEELRRYGQMHDGTTHGLTELESVRGFQWLIGGPNDDLR